MQSHRLAAAVGIAVAFTLSGCGGGGSCTIALTDKQKATAKTMMLGKDLDTTCPGVEADCCTAINAGIKTAVMPAAGINAEIKTAEIPGAPAVGAPPVGTPAETKAGEALIGKCGKTDQVGLYNCVKKNAPPQFANSPYFSGDVKADTSADGVGTCDATPPGAAAGMSCHGVSDGCCAVVKDAINNAANIAKQTDVADYIGKCGKKDQESLLKCGKAAHAVPGSPQAMLLAFSTLRTEMLATKTSFADNAFDGTQLQVAAMAGFLAGATVFGLGAWVYQQRARSSFEEPMIA